MLNCSDLLSSLRQLTVDMPDVLAVNWGTSTHMWADLAATLRATTTISATTST